MMRKTHPDTRLTLREAFDKYYDVSELSARTKGKFRYHLTAWERWTDNPPVGNIDDDIAAAFRDRAQQETSAVSVNGIWNTVRSILRLIGPRETGNPRGRGIITQVPYMKPCRVFRDIPRRIPLDWLGAVYAACDIAVYPSRTRGVPTAAWWRALIVTAFFTGLRKSDLLALRFDQIDLAAGTVNFRAIKTGKAAEYPLHPVLLRHLAAVMGTDRERVFHGTASTGSRFYAAFHQIQRRAGIDEPFGLHDIRRTASSEINRAAPGMAGVFLQHAADDVTGLSYLNQMEELSEALVKMRYPPEFDGKPHAIRESSPPPPKAVAWASINPDSWKFPRGGFSYRGHFRHLEGRLLRVLKALVTPSAVTLDELRLHVGGKATSAGAVRQAISLLRPMLREVCGIAENIDPIPVMSHGRDCCWQLTVPEFDDCEVVA